MRKTNGKKLNIFCENPEGYSATRIEKEAADRGMKVSKYKFSSIFISEDGIYDHDKERIDLSDSENTKTWFLSNIPSAIIIAEILKLNGITPYPLSNKMPFLLMNKFISNNFVSSIDAKTPKTCYIESETNFERCADYVGGLPCVIKKCNGSRGKFVDKINNKQDFIDFVKKQMVYKKELFATKNEFLLQEYIPGSEGTDYRILCFQDEIVGGIKRSATDGDFRSNYSLGGSVEKFNIPQELKNIVLDIMKRSGLFVAGIDFIKSGDDWFCMETNTLPQFKGFETATDINVAKLIVDKLFNLEA